jgi:hypothetical protein
MGVIGDDIRPPNAAPYRMPVRVGPSGTAIPPDAGLLPVGMEVAPSTVVALFTGLGVRGGAVVEESSGTVRGKPFGPLPAWEDTVIGGSQSS